MIKKNIFKKRLRGPSTNGASVAVLLGSECKCFDVVYHYVTEKHFTFKPGAQSNYPTFFFFYIRIGFFMVFSEPMPHFLLC